MSIQVKSNFVIAWLLVLCAQRNCAQVNRTIIQDKQIWATATWKENNQFYAKIRAEIDDNFLHHTVDKTMLQQLQKAASSNYSDSKDFYRWAYAKYVDSKQETPIENWQLGEGAFEGPRPNISAYDYVRLRFLYAAPGHDADLIPLAQRLIKRKPDDYDVLYALVKLYHPVASNTEKQRALLYANQLITLFPQKADPYTAVGGIYYEAWLYSKKPADRNKAIQNYQKYLDLAPPTDTWRKQATMLIKEMQAGS